MQVTGPKTSCARDLRLRRRLDQDRRLQRGLREAPAADRELRAAATASSIQDSTRSASRGWISGPTSVSERGVADAQRSDPRGEALARTRPRCRACTKMRCVETQTWPAW